VRVLRSKCINMSRARNGTTVSVHVHASSSKLLNGFLIKFGIGGYTENCQTNLIIICISPK
jgi:hypothetical protein